MRRVLVVLVALATVLGCEERFSSNPPPLPPGSLGPAPSSDIVDTLMAPTPTDAGPAPSELSRALTITLCSVSVPPCPAAEADGGYEVVFGSGRGAVRTRGQAMADLYKELRDRTASGERLDAEAHPPGDGGAAHVGGSSTKASASDDDPLSQCAFQLLDLVDGVGEVTLDVIHGSGAHGCRISLGRTPDGGALRCLMKEPERVRRMGR